jgi:hypothetical protein
MEGDILVTRHMRQNHFRDRMQFTLENPSEAIGVLIVKTGTHTDGRELAEHLAGRFGSYDFPPSSPALKMKVV